ncbi:MAG: Mor transcription activator family protein [Burkholderia gladioli]
MSEDRFVAPPHYPDVLEHIAQIVHQMVRAHGLPPQAAQAAALDITDAICWHFRGSQPYIPLGVRYRTFRRDVEMASKFTGNNHEELAREYDLTPSRVRVILKEIARAEHASWQLDIFDAPS